MNIDVLILGYLDTNCYIITKDNKTIIIDPADESEKIIDFCKDKNVTEILVTHHHPDHIGALDTIEKHFNLKHNQFIKSIDYEVITNPGHTDDSISFYFKDDKFLFCGDFIFHGSIGRFDFPNSSETDMKNSLDMISKYPDDITLYPGHGPKTNLGTEKGNFKYFF